MKKPGSPSPNRNIYVRTAEAETTHVGTAGAETAHVGTAALGCPVERSSTAVRKLPVLFAALLFPLVLSASLAWAGDDVEQQLKTDYLDKVLTLRHFYKGDHLVFQSDGALVSPATVGPWTVAGQISVEEIKVGDHALHIRGRRVFEVFDAKAKPFRDVLNMLDESNADDREKLEKFFQTQKIKIEIHLPSNRPDLSEASSAMKAVFLAPGESMADIVPDFWRDYFDQQEGRPRSTPEPAETVYKSQRGETSSPHATYRPNPEFSEEARLAKFNGDTTMSLVVDPSGTARDIQILKPLGLGLDEKAVESVSQWKFVPGERNGTPVPVQIRVEVSFHLY